MGKPDSPVGGANSENKDALENKDGVGLGVDIVDIDRMARILKRTPCFAQKVFSPAERTYCDSTSNPAAHYAARFAAKEAVLKALGTGFSRGIGVRDVEVRRSSKGRPSVALTGRAREVARELGVVDLPLSLSHTHTEAVACAMAITEQSLEAAQRRVDPMEELSRQFKEARELLDDIDGDAAAAVETDATNGCAQAFAADVPAELDLGIDFDGHEA